MRTNSLLFRVEKAINRRKSPVVMRKDLENLGGYDQVGRTLRTLVKKKKLARLGYGVYVKTRISSLTGNIIPVASIDEIGKEILSKLKKEAFPLLEEDYNTGRSDQVPTGRLFFVKGRMSRQLTYQGKKINFVPYQ